MVEAEASCKETTAGAPSLAVRVRLSVRRGGSDDVAKVWFSVPTESRTVGDVLACVAATFGLRRALTTLSVDGYHLPPNQPAALIREGDVVAVTDASEPPPPRKEKKRALSAAQVKTAAAGSTGGAAAAVLPAAPAPPAPVATAAPAAKRCRKEGEHAATAPPASAPAAGKLNRAQRRALMRAAKDASVAAPAAPEPAAAATTTTAATTAVTPTPVLEANRASDAAAGAARRAVSPAASNASEASASSASSSAAASASSASTSTSTSSSSSSSSSSEDAAAPQSPAAAAAAARRVATASATGAAPPQSEPLTRANALAGACVSFTVTGLSACPGGLRKAPVRCDRFTVLSARGDILTVYAGADDEALRDIHLGDMQDAVVHRAEAAGAAATSAPPLPQLPPMPAPAAPTRTVDEQLAAQLAEDAAAAPASSSVVAAALLRTCPRGTHRVCADYVVRDVGFGGDGGVSVTERVVRAAVVGSVRGDALMVTGGEGEDEGAGEREVSAESVCAGSVRTEPVKGAEPVKVPAGKVEKKSAPAPAVGAGTSSATGACSKDGNGKDGGAPVEGTVKKWVAEKGFGFIATAGRGDVFAHWRSFEGDRLVEGARVRVWVETDATGKTRAAWVEGEGVTWKGEGEGDEDRTSTTGGEAKSACSVAVTGLRPWASAGKLGDCLKERYGIAKVGYVRIDKKSSTATVPLFSLDDFHKIGQREVSFDEIAKGVEPLQDAVEIVGVPSTGVGKGAIAAVVTKVFGVSSLGFIHLYGEAGRAVVPGVAYTPYMVSRKLPRSFEWSVLAEAAGAGGVRCLVCRARTHPASRCAEMQTPPPLPPTPPPLPSSPPPLSAPDGSTQAAGKRLPGRVAAPARPIVAPAPGLPPPPTGHSDPSAMSGRRGAPVAPEPKRRQRYATGCSSESLPCAGARTHTHTHTGSTSVWEQPWRTCIRFGKSNRHEDKGTTATTRKKTKKNTKQEH